MPTDVGSVLDRKVEMEVQAAKAELFELMVMLFWLMLGWLLMTLIFKYGLDMQSAAILVTGG